MSFEGTTREQQPPNLANHGDDANPDLVAAVPNARSNKANESRIDNLLNILQGKSTKQSWDPTLIRYIEEGDDEEGRLKGGWELFIQPNDWDLLINRGLTWAQLEIFVEAQDQKPVVIGPLCLSVCEIGYDYILIWIDGIQFHRFRNRSSDEADIKRVIASLVKLLCASREVHECALYSNAVTMRCILENYEYLRNMAFLGIENFDLQIWRKCVDHPNLIELAFDDCSFVDEGVTFCKWLANRKAPIAMLSLDTVKIDASILALTLRSTACVKKLCISNNSYQEADWDAVTNAVSEMQNLKSISLKGQLDDRSKFIEWLSVLMTNTHLQSIKCRFAWDSSQPELDSDTQKEITGQIYALLNDAPHVLELQVPMQLIDEEMWKSQVEPSYIERQAMYPSRVLEGATMEDAASLFGRILCKDEDDGFNVNVLFQLLRHSSDTVAALWNSGREKRMVALESNMCVIATRYIEMSEHLLLPNRRVGEAVELLEKVRKTVVASPPSSSPLTRPTKMSTLN